MIQAIPEQVWWPMSALGEALGVVARRLSPDNQAGSGMVVPPPPANDADALPEWIGWAGSQLGIEALPVAAELREMAGLCAGGGPAFVIDRTGPDGRFLLIVRGRGRHTRLLGPDGRIRRVTAQAIAAHLGSAQRAALEPQIERVLDTASLAGARRDRTLAAMVRHRIGTAPVDGLFLLRLPSSAPFFRHMRLAGLPGRLALILGLFALLYAAEIGGWRLIGAAGLDGRIDMGWLAAWLLLIVTMAPGQWLGRLWQGQFAQDVGQLLRARLMAGALTMAPDAVRREGVGGLISRVMEAEALESSALTGGMALLVALIEAGFAGWVLSLGAAPGLHLALLGLWLAAGIVVALAFHRRIAAWTTSRLGLTADLVAAMIGHRTRLVQQDPAARDRIEDASLAGYAATATAMDRASLVMNALLGPGWSLVALAALAPALVSPAHPSAARLAVSLGGILLAQRAISGMAGGFLALSRAWLSWEWVGSMVRAAAQAEPEAKLPPAALRRLDEGSTAVAARGLRFVHKGASRAVIEDLDLTIAPGERVLVEGPSGGGKSTFAALLAGLRQPERGLLTIGGLDRHTLGNAWHRHVSAAPQFHENHVLSGSLAFNLLMGRTWPPSKADLAEARAVCEDLGLGPLIARMPAGLQQHVGETGWQLSHGERSRVFLARAILAGARLTILDESFGPLDPETLETCLVATMARTNALMVIAHP